MPKHHLLLVCLGAFSALPARGADSIVVLAVDRCSQEATSGSARLLRKALAAHARGTVRSEEETLGPLGGPSRGSLAEAERLLASARFDYYHDHPAYERAERSLRDSAAVLLALPPGELRWETLREVFAFQALVYLGLHRESEAEGALEKVLRVEPGYRPDPTAYSPVLRSLAEKVRRRVKAASSGALTIASRPPGAPIFVDGHGVGAAPVTLKLPPGEYRVEGGFGPERTAARYVRVHDTSSVELDLAFEGSFRLDAGPCLETAGTRQSRLAMLVKAAALLGASHVVGVWAEEPSPGEQYLVAGAVDAATGQEQREAKVKIRSGILPEGAIEKLARFVSTGEEAPPVEAVVTEPEPASAPAGLGDPARGATVSGDLLGSVARRQGSAARRTWGLRVGGAGVALLATGVVFDLLAHGAYSAEQQAGAAGDSARYESERSRAASRATAANVFYVLGAVGAGAGAVLYLTGREPPASVAVAPIEGGAVAVVSGRWP